MMDTPNDPATQAETPNLISDLLYCGDSETYREVQADILQIYPNATFEDASDFVHQWRFNVVLEDTFDGYLYNALALGCFNISLAIQLERMDKPAHLKDIIEQVLADQRAASTEGE